MHGKFNSTSLALSIALSAVLQYFLYRYNSSFLYISEFSVGIVISLIYIGASALSVKGFFGSLIFLPLLAIAVYSESISSTFDNFTSFMMTILIMTAMAIVTWVFVIFANQQGEKKTMTADAKNGKREILEILKELEYLEIPQFK